MEDIMAASGAVWSEGHAFWGSHRAQNHATPL